MKRLYLGVAALLVAVMQVFASCSDDNASAPDIPDAPDVPEAVAEDFAKGADVSWLTRLESEGYKFRTAQNREKELMALLRDDCGVNAIRLRVWVNPSDGWDGPADVLVKARRANALGLRLMIDFHFADTWADPGHQPTPAAWAGMEIDELCGAVSAHVKDVLGMLKAEGITPEWVQVGNETTQGMLWPLGKDSNPENFTRLVNAGYDAVKSICPEAKVIVHLDQGNDLWRYNHIFGILKANGGKYDMIGMSLYPDASNWQQYVSQLLENIDTVYSTYGKPVMVCEIGMHYTQGEIARDMIRQIRTASKAKPYIQGVFYWEPEAPEGYNGGYDKGCFVNGSPNQALDAFK